MEQDIIAGLDIGTTKVCVVIAQRTNDGLIVLGAGIAPSYGLRKGIVVNIDSTGDAIIQAVEEAELMSGTEILRVFTAITGQHVKGQNSRGIVAVSTPNREISEREVNRVIEAAQTIHIPNDKEIIHIIPWEFIVDGQDGVKDPVGMSGVRLEVDTHLVYGAVNSIQNITKSVNSAKLEVHDFVLNALASAEAVLSDDEKELGTLLIDIGGETSDVILFVNGGIRYSAVFPIGSKHVTKDISIGLRVPDNMAERIKINYQGCLTQSDIEIPAIAGRANRSIPNNMLSEIIEPRMEEIFDIIYRDVVKEKVLDLAAGGLVLTGGGSLINGVLDIADRVFNLPVRLGYPDHIGGLNDKINSPIYATAVGLTVYGLREENAMYYEAQPKKNIFYRMKHSISDFAKEFFA